MYVVNPGAPRKEKLKIDNSKIIVGDSSTLLLIMGRTTQQKVNKEIENLNNTINQLHPIDIYKTLRPTTEYIFLSSAHRGFFRVDNMQAMKQPQ